MASASRIWCWSFRPRPRAAEPEKKLLGFETLTFAPIDRNLIETGLLSADERRWVDDYHAEVLRVVGPQLDGDAMAWLEAGCAPLVERCKAFPGEGRGPAAPRQDGPGLRREPIIPRS